MAAEAKLNNDSQDMPQPACRLPALNACQANQAVNTPIGMENSRNKIISIVQYYGFNMPRHSGKVFDFCETPHE